MFASAVRILHLELTTRCTLACPRCPRTHAPAEWSLRDLPLVTLVETVNRFTLPELREVLLCGNYGDPIYHPDFHRILGHLRREGLTIAIDTNASFRPRSWWRETAALLGPRDQVNVSVDGLEDTNALYRVNSRWSDVVAAIEELAAAGRRVQWKFIVFRHNEHQVEDARALARRLGCAEFKIVRSNRFGGRWAVPDGVDPLRPSDPWVSTRLAPAGGP
jgi:MoaA/NifB/PqqE/SkfB family radical SAM enzyme